MNESSNPQRGHFPFPVIDFHVHLFPDNFFDAIWAAFRRDYGWDVRYRLYTAETLRFLRRRGVKEIVYSNYAHKEGAAAYLNRWNLELLEREADLYCFAAYHPEGPEGLAAAREMLRRPRVLGFKLQLLVQRIRPDDERFFPLYEAVIEADKRILMHVGTGPVGNEFVGCAYFEKLMRRYPALKVNVPHMGALEYGPFMDLLDEYPQLRLDTAFAFLSQDAGRFSLGREALLRRSDRILYGSDFPNVIHPWDEEIRFLKSLELGEEFYRRVFRENALELLPTGVS